MKMRACLAVTVLAILSLPTVSQADGLTAKAFGTFEGTVAHGPLSVECSSEHLTSMYVYETLSKGPYISVTVGDWAEEGTFARVGDTQIEQRAAGERTVFSYQVPVAQDGTNVSVMFAAWATAPATCSILVNGVAQAWTPQPLDHATHLGPRDFGTASASYSPADLGVGGVTLTAGAEYQSVEHAHGHISALVATDASEILVTRPDGDVEPWNGLAQYNEDSEGTWTFDIPAHAGSSSINLWFLDIPA